MSSTTRSPSARGLQANGLHPQRSSRIREFVRRAMPYLFALAFPGLGVAAVVGGSAPFLYAVYFGVAVTALLAEQFIPWVPVSRRWRGRKTDVLYLVTSPLLAVVIQPVLLGLHSVRVSLLGDQALWVTFLPLPAQVALAFVAFEFVDYWTHRISHRNNVLWRSHRIHESPERLDWLMGWRIHWLTEIVYVAARLVPFVLLGVPPQVIAIVVVIKNVLSMFVHLNADVDSGRLLNLIIVTPDLHRRHHLQRTRLRTVNLGSATVLWDHIFGTYRRPGLTPDTVFGIPSSERERIPDSWSEQLLSPWRSPKAPAPQESRWRRITIAVTVMWTSGLLLCAVILVIPLPRQMALSMLYLAANGISLWFDVLTLIGVGLAVFVRSWGRRWLFRTSVAAAAVATIASLVPLATSLPSAHRTGTPLSLSANLFGGINFSAKPPNPARTVSYATVGGQELPLDVWQPAAAKHPAPAVLWIHGGGFVMGQQSRTPKWDEWLNQRGYAVFDVGYRLAPPARWDQAVGDVKCAIGWVKSHAVSLNIDPNRIMVAGQSAGGNLALQAAYTPTDPKLPPSCEAGDTSVQAVAAFYPLTDLVADFNTGIGRELVQAYVGGTPSTQPERYRIASPINHVRPMNPPTLLLQGERDSLLSNRAEEARLLDAKLSKVGVPHRLVTLPSAEHSFDIAWGSWSTQIAKHVLDDFMGQYLPKS
jgi:acetyl esterase/lipase/sterol desaturase/sphingolipid hydroxylase (fatty acid hydroxylase superfamily)